MTRLVLFATLFPATAAPVDLSLIDGYAFVQVHVNGRGPFRMLVDTGASSCVLSPEAAERAALAYDHRVTTVALGGARLVAAASARVQVGGLEAFDAEVLAQPIEAVRKVDSKADGILGQSFLGRFPYLIDYKKKRLLVGPEAEAQSAMVGPAMTTEQIEGRPVLAVSLTAGGRSWRLALDSGTQRLLVQCGHGCPRMAEHIGEGKIVTNGGERRVERGYLKRVEVGGLAIVRADALLVESVPESGREDGLLPARMFSAVYVDPARGQARLAR